MGSKLNVCDVNWYCIGIVDGILRNYKAVANRDLLSIFCHEIQK